MPRRGFYSFSSRQPAEVEPVLDARDDIAGPSLSAETMADIENLRRSLLVSFMIPASQLSTEARPLSAHLHLEYWNGRHRR